MERQQTSACLLILLLLHNPYPTAGVPHIDLLGRAEQSQPDLGRKDTEKLGGNLGCPGHSKVQDAAMPGSRVLWGT